MTLKISRVTVLVLALLVTGLLVHTGSAWWNTGWRYRQQVDIAGNGNTSVIQYQMLLNIYNISGASSDNTLYTEHISLANFSDVRIIGSDDTTLLQYWINETWDDHCDLWVRIPSIDMVTGSSIYVYYNRATASSVTDGYSTWDFYDNFEGIAVNNTQWIDSTSDGGTITVSDSIIDLEGPGGESKARISSLRTFLLKDGKRIMWRSATDNKWTLSEGMQRAGDEVLFFEDSVHRVTSYHSCGGADYDYNAVTAITHGVYTLRQFTENISSDNCGDKRFQVSQNNIVEVSKTEDDTVGNVNMYINYDVYASGGYIKLDWVHIGNYTYPEPLFSTWGNEESSAAPPDTALQFSPIINNNITVQKGETWIKWNWSLQENITQFIIDDQDIYLNGSLWKQNYTHTYFNLPDIDSNSYQVLEVWQKNFTYDNITQCLYSAVRSDPAYVWWYLIIGLGLLCIGYFVPLFGFLAIIILLLGFYMVYQEYTQSYIVLTYALSAIVAMIVTAARFGRKR